MKALKSDFSQSGERAPSDASKAKPKERKPMDFAAWVEQYVAMSNGNPV